MISPRTKRGSSDVESVPCDVGSILTSVRTLLAGRATDKQLELKIQFRTRIPRSIHSDPVRLRQALINLVSNAIKFTDEGEITL